MTGAKKARVKKNLLSIIKFEYLRTVKRPAFWFSTFLVPLIMMVVVGITAYSNIQAEKKSKEVAQDKEKIVVVDEAGIISDKFELPIVGVEDLDKEIEQVKKGELDLIVYVPEDFAATKQYSIYAADKGIISNGSYKNVASYFINSSIIDGVENPSIKSLINAKLNVQEKFFDKDGKEIVSGFHIFVLPIISFLIFFLSVFIGAQYLLQSVSEEKENRMIETLLAIVDARDLIWGKIAGLSLVILTQMGVWMAGAVSAFFIGNQTLSILEMVDMGLVKQSITFGAVGILLCLVLCGFLLYSAIMVGVGSVATSQKDSQSLSAVFIIMAVLPMYFIPVLISDPNGVIAKIFSYFPSTSAFTLALRNSLGVLGAGEIVLGLILNFIYVVIAFWVAVKMFRLGILMYSRRPSIKEVAMVFFK